MRRVRRILLASVLAGGASTLLVAPSAAQPSDPQVSVDRTGTTEGETMLVTGAGWTSGATVLVELCGHGGIDGSVDCFVTGQRTAGVGPGGNFSVELTTGKPPRPCPCVVKATDTASRVAATAPIAVAGLPTVPITAVDEPADRIVEISELAITGGGGWTELFGASGERTLEITLVNTGAVPVAEPELDVTWGAGSDPAGFVTPPEVERMEPGQTTAVSVDVRFDALTFGQRTAVVTVQGVGSPITARQSMSSYPWGLVALAVVALQLIALAIRNRIRRRYARRPDEDPDLLAIEGAMLGLPVGRFDEDGLDLDEVDEAGERDDTLIDLSDRAIREGGAEPAPPRPTNGHDGIVLVGLTGAEMHTSSHPGDALAAERERVRAAVESEMAAAKDESLQRIAAAHDSLDAARERLELRLAAAAASQRSVMETISTIRAELDAATGRLGAARASADEAVSETRATIEELRQGLDAQVRMVGDHHDDSLRRALDRLDALAAGDSDVASPTPTPVSPPADLDSFDARLSAVLTRAIASATQSTPSVSAD